MRWLLGALAATLVYKAGRRRGFYEGGMTVAEAVVKGRVS